MNKFSVSNKKVIIGLFILILAVFSFFFTSTENLQIKTILQEAEAAKKETGVYGVLNGFNKENYNCFSGETFIKRGGVQKILEAMEVVNVSCKFRVNPETNILEDWSVSVQIGEKVYCGDSTGKNILTPGFTLTPSCKGE